MVASRRELRILDSCQQCKKKQWSFRRIATLSMSSGIRLTIRADEVRRRDQDHLGNTELAHRQLGIFDRRQSHSDGEIRPLRLHRRAGWWDAFAANVKGLSSAKFELASEMAGGRNCRMMMGCLARSP